MTPDRLFAPLDLAGRDTVLAAVSGGSDSTALLLLLIAWRDTLAPHLRIVAATVDHDLRPESAAEAQGVARLCQGLGIPHRILHWTGPKPAKGLPATARMARYRLLADLAGECGSDIVLTGHTADDQAETLAMRAARGTAVTMRRGDAGMAPYVLYDDRVWLLRPLLRTGRATLRAHLVDRNVGWFDDPGNLSPALERGRLRLSSAASPRQDTQAAARRLALGRAAADIIIRHAGLPAPGLVRLAPAFLAGPDAAARLYAFRLLLASVGGTAQLPPLDAADALLHASTPRATLSRALLDRRRTGLYLHREHRDLPCVDAAPGSLVWDRRWRLVVPAGIRGTIAPAGDRPFDHAGRDAGNAPPALVSAARATLPVLRGPAGEAALWQAADSMPVIGPWHDFLPGFDLAPAAALRALFGMPVLPPPPWRDHIDGDV